MWTKTGERERRVLLNTSSMLSRSVSCQDTLAAVKQVAVILVIIANPKKSKYVIIRNVQNNIQKDNYR